MEGIPAFFLAMYSVYLGRHKITFSSLSIQYCYCSVIFDVEGTASWTSIEDKKWKVCSIQGLTGPMHYLRDTFLANMEVPLNFNLPFINALCRFCTP